MYTGQIGAIKALSGLSVIARPLRAFIFSFITTTLILVAIRIM